MQTVATNLYQTTVTTKDTNATTKPFEMIKRIGSTVYEVNVYFNQDAKETMDDKIMRLIRNEAQGELMAG